MGIPDVALLWFNKKSWR